MSLASAWQRMKRLEWRDLELRNASQWPPILQWLCCGLVAVALSMMSLVYLVLPTQQSLAAAEREEAQLRDVYRRKASVAAHLPNEREDLAATEVRLAALSMAFPESADMASLIDDISTSALNRRLSIASVRLEKTTTGRLVVAHPISLEVTGDYHRLGDFVADVAQLLRLVTLHDIRLERRDGQLRLSMEVRAYRRLATSDEASAGNADREAAE